MTREQSTYNGIAVGDRARSYGARTNHIVAHIDRARSGNLWTYASALCGASVDGRTRELRFDPSKPTCAKCLAYEASDRDAQIRDLAPDLAEVVMRVVDEANRGVDGPGMASDDAVSLLHDMAAKLRAISSPVPVRSDADESDETGVRHAR